MSNTKPTDLELMLYADGELDGDRIAAVEAFLARDASAQKKLRALDVAASAVRERADEIASSADGIADLVMASLASEAKGETANEAPVLTKRSDAPKARAANDNARGIWAIVAIAVAAAAAFALWTRGSTPDVATSPTARRVSQHAASGVAKAPKAGDSGSKAGASAREAPSVDAQPGVEVSAVDFGAHVGALFYVPTGPEASEMTTVVWLSDDSAGGDQ